MTTTPVPISTDYAEPGSRADQFLPFSAPWFGSEEKEEILQVLESDWITTGPRTRKFEAAFREYIGCEEAVAVNSCTAALHLALSVLEVGNDDAVLTSPLTFAATANVIVHRGAHPVFIDIRPDTYNLDPDKLREFLEQQCSWDVTHKQLRILKTGKRIRAIIAVHYGGHPADMTELLTMARKYDLAVIEDAAHALGASYNSKNVGILADMACFSFYPTKNISTGEGGMLTTNDAGLAQRARVLSLHGISRDAWKRYGAEGSWQYDIEEAGYKYNLTDLASALGLHQLKKLSSFIERRIELASIYAKRLAGLPLQLPIELNGVRSAWHLYPIQILDEKVSRDQLIQELRSRNIGTSVHFIPLHLMTFYQKAFGYKRGDYPEAERVFARILSVPFFPRMTDLDVERVVGALYEILGQHNAFSNRRAGESA